MSAVPLSNVYYMLTYAYEVLKSKEYERLNREEFNSIYDLLATLLLCGTNDLIKRGFLKSYISQTDELTAIKGRINISNSIRKLSFQNAKAVCDFDEFSADIYFNQIIKATFLFLKRRPVKTTIKRDISKILLYFNEIGTLGISTIKWDTLVFNRNNAHYDTLLYFCRLICEEAIANQEKGKNNFRIIEDRLLPKLFEKFVYAFYKQELSGCRVHYQKKIKWKSDVLDMLPEMNADTIILEGSHILIIDTKYYSKTSQIHPFSNNKTVISSHIFQIFTYVKNEAANSPEASVSGMLLYPRVDEEMKCAPYGMDGNKVFVRTVDLNQEFPNIRQELLEIYQAFSTVENRA
jgi:5-methylcytosine-specific restriction enzyme subunit McrC